MPSGSDFFDVAVVGGGPAGATAARAAETAGARVCLLERAAVPRYKTCGGGIVGLSADNAGIDLGPLERSRVDRITITLNGRFAVTRGRRGGPTLVSMVMRDELDAALLAAARAAGAEVRTRAVVTGITQEPAGGGGSRSDGPHVEGAHVEGAHIGGSEDGVGVVRLGVRSGPDVRASVVVGADGTAGRTGGYVGVRFDQVDLGLEGEFPAGERLARQWAGRVLLDWGPVPGSYGWVFPKGDVLTVGVIGPKDQADPLRAYYADFLARFGLAGVEPLHDTGHLTRVRAVDSPLRRGGVIVAGDAAGLLDPWTREGISFALRSGRLAGEAAAAAVGGQIRPGSLRAGGLVREGAARAGGSARAGDRARPRSPARGQVTGRPAALDDYQARVEAVVGPEMAAGRDVQGVFARHPVVMHALLGVMPGGFGLFGRIVAGNSTVGRQLRRPGVAAVVGLLSR